MDRQRMYRAMIRLLSVFTLLGLLLATGCEDSTAQSPPVIQAVDGTHQVDSSQAWLSHEHILVDFVGADAIRSHREDHEEIMQTILPYLEALDEFNVRYFVDATPNYLGRDVVLLEKLAEQTGIHILTNTGLYGARDDKFIPESVRDMTAAELAASWIDEYRNGIDGTAIKPGFIKIGVDNADPLHPLDQKLVRAAALTHLETGLTIASHTGKAKGLWPQLRILRELGVSPEVFIWVHAQAEQDHASYLRAAEMGCWISFDGLGREVENHAEKILYAKRQGILGKVLLSHDAGWYDPQKEKQEVRPYTNMFVKLRPVLKSRGFTDDEFRLLVRENPLQTFQLGIREYHGEKSD